MNAVTLFRLDEQARDVARELALVSDDEVRALLLSRFLHVVAEEVAAAVAHRERRGIAA